MTKRTKSDEQALADTLHAYCVQKLEEKQVKPHWCESSNTTLFIDLFHEIDELAIAIIKKLPKEEVWKEAADIANFAAMIADNYMEE